MSEFIYLKFEYSKKEVIGSENASKLHEFMTWVLGKVIPVANPDFDLLLHKVSTWKIEFNIEKKHTNREIGFNEKGRIITAMPMGKNHGYWCDNQLQIEDYKKFNAIHIDKEEFEKDWKEFQYIFKTR